jgi:hypothetical protein
MAIYSIYRLTNLVNGKVYIGKTKRDPHQRYSAHLQDAVKGSPFVLHIAIRKHGPENFKFEVIFNTFEENDLNTFERDFIAEHDCCILDGYERGYNMTRGGDGLDSEMQSIIQRRRVQAGTHNWLGGEHNKKRVANRTHNWMGERGSNNQRKRLAEGSHHFTSENRSKWQHERIKNGTHHFSGERGSELQLRRVKDGTHPFLGSELNNKRIANGTHPFHGEKGSLLAKQVQAKRLAENKHPFQGEKGAMMHQRLIEAGEHISQKKLICPHCNKEGHGATMFRWHFDKCKKLCG